MQNEILPSYALKRSDRSRSIRLTVLAGGRVVVSAPKRVSQAAIDSFLAGHLAWLRGKVEHFKKLPERRLFSGQEEKLFEAHKQKAENLAAEKIKIWNEGYRFSLSKITVRNSRSRWGSCSSKGALSFNYKIVFLPERLADYLVVHELCHLKERNHGKAFWELVAAAVPDYAVCRRELRDFEKTFELPPSGV